MKPNVTIHPITEADVPPFRECLHSVAQERVFLALTSAPPPQQCIEFVKTLLIKGGPMFIARDQDTVVGWCDITPGDTILGRHPGTLGMGVLKTHRSQGVGRRLLETTLEAASQQGMQEVHLTVRMSNQIAIHLYEKCGFKKEKELPAYLEVDGQKHDCLKMKLDLNAWRRDMPPSTFQ